MRASKLVMCALSSTQALDEALVRSVQCSKQARKALARGDVPVAWLDVTAADDAVAERGRGEAVLEEDAEGARELLRLVEEVRDHRAHAALVDDRVFRAVVAAREIDPRLRHREQQPVVVGAEELDGREQHVRRHQLLALEVDLRHQRDLVGLQIQNSFEIITQNVHTDRTD